MLQLREMQADDVTYFTRWWNDPELRALTSGVEGVVSPAEVAQYVQEMRHSTDRYDWMIMTDSVVVGHVSLVMRDEGWWETQIVIGEKEWWNKGLGTEALRDMVRRAAAHGIFKIFLEVRPENIRAIRAYEKVGFKRLSMSQQSESLTSPQLLRMELAG